MLQINGEANKIAAPNEMLKVSAVHTIRSISKCVELRFVDVVLGHLIERRGIAEWVPLGKIDVTGALVVAGALTVW